MATFPIIEKLGGRAAMPKVLRRQGLRPKTVDAVRMWVARGQIPGEAQRALMREADNRSIPYTADDFELIEKAAA